MKYLRSTAFVATVMLLASFLALQADASAAADRSPMSWRPRISSGNDVTTSDIQAEINFGREVAARIIARYGLVEDARLMKYVNLVGKVVAMSTNRPEIEFRFAVLDTSEINAYAAPGGYIFVTRGAIANMEDESELAAVLAHEIGHITEKHMVKELKIKGKDDSASTGLARVIGGTSEAARTAFGQLVDQALDLLFKNGNKREDEVQADKDAVLYCALAGYDPSALVRYFERISALRGRQTQVLDKTHPAYEDRISWLKNVISGEAIDSANFKSNRERFVDVVAKKQ